MKDFSDLIALPVITLLAILAIQSNYAQAGDVRLFDENGVKLAVGKIWAEQKSVSWLKNSVAKSMKLDLDCVRLATINGNILLKDGLLSNYQTIYETELNLRLYDDLKKPGKINVNIGDHRIELVVRKNDTLGWLKKEALGDNNADLYRVIYQGKELTDNSKSLGDLQFYRGANVILWKGNDTFKVTVVGEANSEQQFDVTLETTVEDLKKTIKNMGLDIRDYLFLHVGKVLADKTKLYSHSIQHFFFGYIVHIVRQLGMFADEIKIFQKKTEGIEHHSVTVKSSTTLRQLKEFAFKADNSIQVRWMQLKFNNLVLSGDSRTLKEFDIYPGAWIQVTRQQI